MRENLTIGFIGNPNCGKTTLFNAYTGANLKVANWPGVTVEKVEGAIKDHDLNIRLVDLPGTYSLTSYTMEEQVSRQFILSDEVDVIIDVADASALERNLYLTLQLLELGKPVVLALNKSAAWRLTHTDCRKCWASRSFQFQPENGQDWMCCFMQPRTIKTVKIRSV